MAVRAGKTAAKRADGAPLAGKSTLNRLELGGAEPSRDHQISHDAAKIEALLVDLLLDAHRGAPAPIPLDLDATDAPLFGDQSLPRRRPGRGAFSTAMEPVLGPAKPDPGDSCCDLPLDVSCGRHRLAAKLRRADIDASAGSVEEMARIVARIRARWPGGRILLRAAAGFARER